MVCMLMIWEPYWIKWALPFEQATIVRNHSLSHTDLTGTLRMSLAMYNTKKEIDIFMDALKKVLGMLR